MDSNDSTDLKEQENNLELEQMKIEKAKLEVELEKMKQESAPFPEKLSETKKLPVSYGVLFCLTFLAPIGIIMLWRLRVPIFIKILLTLYSLWGFAVIMGWLGSSSEPWHMIFLFTGQ